MKKPMRTVVATLITLSLLVVAPVPAVNAQINASISLQTFYDELDPYGQWVEDPDYGYVWIADAGPGFRPYYSRGHWVMTDYGAMWVSDYSWGWAPFHYGRWAYSSYYGWVWVPDTVWGPAWVSWRSNDDYYGWAPLGPGISIDLSFGSGYRVPNDWWVFVPSGYSFSPDFHNYRVEPSRNVTYINNTTIINNTYKYNNVTYAAGPRINDLERITGKKIPVYSVEKNNKPGKTLMQGNEVRVYKPAVSDKGNKPADVVSRDQYVQKKGKQTAPVQNNYKPVTSSVPDKQRTQPDRKQQPAIERKTPIKQETKQPTRVERKQPQAQRAPQPERKPQPPNEKKQQPVERAPQPQYERKQQQPAERNPPPATERKQQPVERTQPPQQPKQQPVPEQRRPDPPVKNKKNGR